MKNRVWLAVMMMLVSLAMSFVLGIFFGLIAGNIRDAIIFIFLAFGAPGCVSALLLLITSIPDNLSWGFGLALYYGTLLLGNGICEYVGYEDSLHFFIAFVIVAMACYIAWLTYFKERYQNKD